jgi:hypothetical protein
MKRLGQFLLMALLFAAILCLPTGTAFASLVQNNAHIVRVARHRRHHRGRKHHHRRYPRHHRQHA